MFANLRLSTRLAAVIALLCVTLVAVGAAGLFALRSTNARLQTVYDDRTVPLHQLTRINALMQDNMREIQLALAHDPRLEESRLHQHDTALHLDRVDANIAVITQIWKEYMATYLTPEEKKLAEEFIAHRGRYVKEGVLPAADLLRQAKFAEAGALVAGKLNPLYNEARKLNDSLVQLQVDVARQEFDGAQADYGRFVVLAGLAIALSVLIAAMLGWLLNRAIVRPLSAAVAAANRVAQGDLTVNLATQRGDEIGQLMQALAAMVKRLSETLSEVQVASRAVNSESTELHDEITSLATRTEQQAANLEETAATMEELTSTVKQNADNARQANQLAISASDVASQGGAVVDEVVTTMGAISTSSKRIADIIGVIDGIAFQTNILALNAAVEAARAGEQGRGFAVVATEVRNLAQRSANAAKEISTLITDSVTSVDQGSRLVAGAGRTMAEVVTAVRRVTDIMAEISAASQEQSSGLDQVAQAVAQLDQITQQNADLVQAASASARELDGTSHALAQAMTRFKVEGEAATVVSAPAAEIREPRAAVTAKPRLGMKAAAAKPRALPKSKASPTPAFRGVAPMPALAGAGGDEWSSF
jgi:methyl-accepting chemotaxis protein